MDLRQEAILILLTVAGSPKKQRKGSVSNEERVLHQLMQIQKSKKILLSPPLSESARNSLLKRPEQDQTRRR